MKLSLTTPIQTPVITSIDVLTSKYDFHTGTIILAWNELDQNGNIITTKELELTNQETTDFFATPIAQAADFKSCFVTAFYNYIQSLYGAATIVG